MTYCCDTSLRQFASCHMYVYYAIWCCDMLQWCVAWIEISLNSGNMARQQNVACTFRPLVWHARATWRCDNSVNKPIAGLPCDAILIVNSLPVPSSGVSQATCRSIKLHCVSYWWFCRCDMLLRHVAATSHGDKPPRVTGPYKGSYNPPFIPSNVLYDS